MSIQSQNAMPNRNYYVPYASLEQAKTSTHKFDSSRVMSLDGTWDFTYFENERQLPANFFSQVSSDFSGSIEVPSVWQNAGFDHHQYVNVTFPIPYDPPFVPTDNPCGLYHRTFELNCDDSNRYYLNFEGVDSCHYVWVNGQWVGYNQISHSQSEFDITDYCQSGTNHLTVLVFKWSDGTYFEDQDKFRSSGIFRSVYLVERPQAHLQQFRVNTTIDLEKVRGDLIVTFDDVANTLSKKYWLYDTSGELVAHEEDFGGQLAVTIENCQYWTAETPNLYTLIMEVNGEFFKQKIGFRELAWHDRQVYLNGQSIKLLGVNYHDNDPITTRVMTPESLKKDMLMMKAINMNTIRTAHYPKMPEFYELADELGFYVVSEADLECHGIVNLYGNKANYNLVGSDESFLPGVLERIERSVVNNINFPSIIMWSMENESGYGLNFEIGQARTRELDPTRLIHNERAIEPDSTRDNDMSNLDVISMMYPDLRNIEKMCQDESLTKPLFMCEYAHAMGNGPGELKDYFDLIMKYDGYLGGCVWEWADHAVSQTQADGSVKYLYGGDFNEEVHDNNFCVDGMTTPDRKMTAKLIAYRNIHAPLQLVSIDLEAQQVILKNINRFKSADAYQASLRLKVDGVIVKEQSLELSDFPAHSEKTFSIMSLDYASSQLVTVELVITYLEERPIEEHNVVGIQELIIHEPERVIEVENKDEAIEGSSLKVSTSENQDTLVISGDDFSYTWQHSRAGFKQLTVAGQDRLVSTSHFTIWRAPTDNDMYIKQQWLGAGYDRATLALRQSHVEQTDESVTIQNRYALVVVGKQPVAQIELNVTIQSTGEILMDVTFDKDPEFPDLPKFGLNLPLTKELADFEYLGYGPYDNYRDKKEACQIGVYQSTPMEEWHHEYIKPQEYGNHGHCEWLRIGQDHGFEIKGVPNFSYLVHSTEQLTRCANDADLVAEDAYYLSLDYQQNGIGTNSCGPYVQEKNRFSENHFNWQFSITPII
ncbi:glycoside hydrolase family 2 TIM barrel-domain containing protein [Vagococcus zengguangii]